MALITVLLKAFVATVACAADVGGPSLPTTTGQADLLSSLSDGQSCDVVPLVLTIHPPRRYSLRCTSSQVVTFGCRGHCSSYVKGSVDSTTGDVRRHCKCCQPTKFGVQLAAISCRDGTRLRAALKFTRECMCRPCQDLDVPDVSPDYPVQLALEA